MFDALVNINWLSFLAPISWLISLVVEFGIYSLILYVAMCIMRIPCKKDFFWKYIFSVFCAGMLSNTLSLMIANFITINLPLIYVLPTLISAVINYAFCYYLVFRNEILSKRKKLSIIFAIAILILGILNFLL
jgi:hypothetical protein